ncbi:caspase family protein [Labrys wisconsinensis]|uniref:TPR repeat protein/uncharacterized caspase-like protein n=1 Tax=Labrys wisconsinensis TaxID=425677 RepID=A0ABU0J9H3_9HYPH|nr:caspase family protein [Labrys wisconsinensis]MDQ0470922.1 TPR repeat protein/uncharacterized caspase-like protein [Labrys wisconsinensis]
MKFATRLTVAFAFLALVAAPGSALADKRVALLIGNASYTAVSRLTNPPNDVAAMKAALETAGFDKVDTALDLGREAMVRTLRTFEDESTDADIAVVYYSGHGMEMNGENFLVPVDAKLNSDRDVEDEAVSLDRVLRSIDGAKRLKLVILDACRNNPFIPKMAHTKANRAVERGLGRVDPQGADTLIAFAAKAGTVASDGDDQNSPFTASLVKRLIEPGVDIRLALGNVRDDVLAATARQQEPFAYGSLGGGTIILSKQTVVIQQTIIQPQTNTTPPNTAVNSCTDAAAHWAEAQKFDRIELYERHLQLFGNCAFADFARLKIEDKKREKEQQEKLAAVTPVQPLLSGTTPVTECDRLAAEPGDADRAATGINFDDIDAAAAVTACQNAMAQYPSAGRLPMQLGRALYKLQRYAEAATAWQKGSDLGSLASTNHVAMAYRDGEGLKKDGAEAVRLFQVCADKGFTECQNNLGYQYDIGDGVPKNDDLAFKYYKLAADQGQGLALNNVAVMYRDGRGVEKDQAKAAQLFLESAKQNITLAYRNLGFAYRDGEGVTPDQAEANRRFKVCADRGNSDCQLNLGYQYDIGAGTAVDKTEAARLYKLAADQGNALAINNLGTMYKDGLGVPKNPNEAFRLYKISADRGEAIAFYNLGLMYKDGIGTGRDDTEAMRLFRQGADKGNTDAMYQVAYMYSEGRGAARDFDEAAHAMVQAIAAGNAFSLKEMTTNFKPWGVPFRKAIQRELQSRGAYRGPINGVFGSDTLSALRSLPGQSG